MAYQEVSFIASHSGKVSWDDGVTWEDFLAGTVSGTPISENGQAKIKSMNMTQIKFITDTYSGIDITKAESLTSAEGMCGNWGGMNNLTSFNLRGQNQITSLYGAWYECFALTSFPLIDTSLVTDFRYAWESLPITSFPLIDTSSGLYFENTWSACQELASFPLLDTSEALSLETAWVNCISLTSFPLLNTSKVLNLNASWLQCTGLTSFPLIDTSLVTDFQQTWNYCASLTSFPLLNTSSGTSFSSTWEGCSSLVCLGGVDTTNQTDTSHIFNNLPSLTAPNASDITAIEGGSNWVNSSACPPPVVSKVLGTSSLSSYSFGGRSVSISEDRAIAASVRYNSDRGYADLFSLDGTSIAFLTAYDGAVNDEYGTSVSVYGTVVAVGSLDDDDDGSSSGSVYLYNSSDGSLITKIVAPDGASGDRFGCSVAVTSNLVAVGAKFAGDGAVYLFNLDGSYISKIVPPSTGTYHDSFGISIDATDDYIIVGEIVGHNTIEDAGRAHLYSGNGTFIRTFEAPDAIGYDQFGCDVSVSGDIVAIGAEGAQPSGNYNGGQAYLYNVDGTYISTLMDPIGSSFENFGWKLSVGYLQNIVYVSCYESRVTCYDLTGAHLYTFDPIETIDVSNDQFGASICASKTSKDLIIGASSDSTAGNGVGAAYIYDYI